jgi:hypothetical protein
MDDHEHSKYTEADQYGTRVVAGEDAQKDVGEATYNPGRPQCTWSAHDRGNRGTIAPSCCHLPGYWYDRDRYWRYYRKFSLYHR